LNLLYKTLFAVALGLVIALFTAAFLSKHVIESERLEEAFVRQQNAVVKSAARYLRPEDFKAPSSPQAQRQFRTFAQELSPEEVVRVVIWSRDQRVIFADLSSLIGKRVSERGDLTRLFKQEVGPLYERRDQDLQVPPFATTEDFLDVYVPIQLGSAVVGAVEIYVASQAVLEPVRRQIKFTSLALALSGAIMLLVLVFLRINLLRATRERAQREQVQKLMGELPQEITQGKLPVLIQRTQEKMRVVLDVDVVEIELWNTEQLETVGHADASAPGTSKRPASKDCEWISANRKPLLIPDLGRKSAQDAPISLDRPRIRGYVGVPLHSRNGAVIGLLRVLSHTPRDFARDLELVQQVANGVSLAVEHAQLQQRSEEQGIKLEVAEQKLADQTAQFNRVKNELEQFAQAVSRNMQEPLRAVANYAFRLAKHHGSKLDEAAQDFVHHATDSAKRMQGIISNVLAYAKTGTAGSQKCAAIDSSAVLVKVLEQLHDMIRKKGAVVTYDRLPVIDADETQMNQLFQNLVANAITYCDKAVPQVHVTGAKDRGFWSFRVKDNGVGILPEHGEKIFDAFHRLHSEEKYPGSGVGLSLCKKIVEAHGGRIWVESQVEAGATFCFTLPLKPPAKSSAGTVKSRGHELHVER